MGNGAEPSGDVVSTLLAQTVAANEERLNDHCQLPANAPRQAEALLNLAGA